MVVDDMFFGESVSETHRVTFRPSSTYTWRNEEQPQIVFTFVTSATSSSSGSGGTTSGGSSSGGGSSTSKPVVGSAILPFRGALDATVFKTGKLALTKAGKAVVSIKSGRYTIDVDDETAKAGFTVQRIRQQPVTLTTAKFVGSHALTIAMKPGQWYLYSVGGKKSYFIVVA